MPGKILTVSKTFKVYTPRDWTDEEYETKAMDYLEDMFDGLLEAAKNKLEERYGNDVLVELVD